MHSICPISEISIALQIWLQISFILVLCVGALCRELRDMESYIIKHQLSSSLTANDNRWWLALHISPQSYFAPKNVQLQGKCIGLGTCSHYVPICALLPDIASANFDRSGTSFGDHKMPFCPWHPYSPDGEAYWEPLHLLQWKDNFFRRSIRPPTKLIWSLNSIWTYFDVDYIILRHSPPRKESKGLGFFYCCCIHLYSQVCQSVSLWQKGENARCKTWYWCWCQNFERKVWSKFHNI